jgi:hypothetical protein
VKPTYIDDYYAYYLGYTGPLVFDTMYCREGMFYLKHPIIQKRVKVYANFDIEEHRFDGFALKAKHCCHFCNEGDKDGNGLEFICVGGMEVSSQMNGEEIKTYCAKAVEVLRCINTTSMPHNLYDYKKNKIYEVLGELHDGYPIEEIPNFNRYFMRLL